jgi:outer membrane protein assembly factor BamA
MHAFRRHPCISIVLAAFFIFLLRMAAQEATEATISYEGRQVSSVELAGRPDLDTKPLKHWIVQPEGAPYSQQKIDQSIAALRKTGQFTDVKLEVTPKASGLQVLLILEPSLYFGIFDFGQATKVIRYNRLLQVSDYPDQEPYTTGRVEEAEANLLTFLHREGFFLATVEPELRIDQSHRWVNVFFHINLRQRAKFGQIVLTGASEDATMRLQRALRSIRARLRGASLRSGKTYSLGKLEKATNLMQTELGKQHYLAGKVKLISAIYSPQTNRADVTFQITQGPNVAVQTEGASVRGGTLRKLIPIYQENTVDADLVAEGSHNLISYFQSKGYFDVTVQNRIDQQPSGTVILYQIEKGRKGKVDSIQITGNQHSSTDFLLRHVTVAKARFLDRGKYSQSLLRSSARNLEAVYRNAGYSQVRVTPSTTRNGDKLAITFQVVEGEQDLVSSLKIEGNKSLTEMDFAPHGLNLGPGRPYSGQLVNNDRDRIMASYLKHGFLAATFRAAAKPVKNEPRRVDVIYSINEGPQVWTATVDTLGLQHTSPNLVAIHAKIPVGQPLNASTLLAVESNMYNLGVFDWASVDTLRPITTDSDAEVLIKVHEAKRHTITYGVGFEVLNRGGNVPGGTVALPNLPPVALPSTFQTSQQTFWGPRGSIQYTLLNFRGRAETLSVGGFAGRLDQRGAASWTVPSFRNSIWSTSITLSGEHNSENPIFTELVAQAAMEFQRPLNARRTNRIVLRYSFSRTDLSNLLIPQLVTPQDEHERLSTLGASFIRDTRDKPLDAHRGIYESVEGDINPSALGSNTDFIRLTGQIAYYHRIWTDNIVWANSFRLGLESAFAGAAVPLSQLFFAGGGSTLRGFSLNGAGPQRAVPVCSNPADPATCTNITVPVGGQQLLILNSELRFPIPVRFPLIGNNLGAAVFYDGGNVYNSVGFQSFGANYTNTIGAGLRYATPVGPVRVDIGHLLTNIPGVRSTQLFITLGQAF